MLKFGIIQGRLTTPKDNRIQFFPKDEWIAEFRAASQVGFDCIEWLYDFHDANMNPISTDNGIDIIKPLLIQHGIQVNSICAHCFIEKPLVGTNNDNQVELLELLDWLFHRAKQVGATRVVLPMEDSSLLNSLQEFDRQVNWMKQALAIAETIGVEIDLETTLNPSMLASFLQELPHDLLKVNYDIGNSAGMGYKIDDEFAAYGQRIGSVHIKDKTLKGPTVAIGTGIADFTALARLLRKIHYDGDIVLEAARGLPGEELSWAKRNLNFILQYLGSNYERPL